MDIRQLKYFIALVETSNFTQASKKLYISQPALTKSLKLLEEELGAELIERNRRSLRTTDAGRAFYRGALDICARFDDLHCMVADVQNQNIGNVRFAIPPVLLNTFFPNLLRSFRQQYPCVKINIDEVGSKLAAELVLADEADVAFVMLPIANPEDYNIQIVTSDVCVVVCNAHHPLAQHEQVTLKDIINEPLILLNNKFTLYDEVLRACHRECLVPNIMYTSSLEEYIVRMVSFNEGITIMPIPLIQKFLNEDIVTIPLKPDILWRIAFITHKNRYLSFASREFIGFSLENFSQFS